MHLLAMPINNWKTTFTIVVHCMGFGLLCAHTRTASWASEIGPTTTLQGLISCPLATHATAMMVTFWFFEACTLHTYNCSLHHRFWCRKTDAPALTWKKTLGLLNMSLQECVLLLPVLRLAIRKRSRIFQRISPVKSYWGSHWVCSLHCRQPDSFNSCSWLDSFRLIYNQSNTGTRQQIKFKRFIIGWNLLMAFSIHFGNERILSVWKRHFLLCWRNAIFVRCFSTFRRRALFQVLALVFYF